jgi:hypothetical protein
VRSFLSTNWDATRPLPCPCLVKVAFIPTTWVFDLVVSKENQNGGKCWFFCKKHIIHLDNDLQQLWVDSVLEFPRFKL